MTDNYDNPDAIVIDPLYRATAREIFTRKQAKDVMHAVMESHFASHPEDRELVSFIEWATKDHLITPPIFPGIGNDKVYLYYRNMCNSINTALDEYRASFPSLLIAYKKEFPLATIDHIAIPEAPSNKWLNVMEPTSIAMGKICSGNDESLERLSPAGVIWRADTVRDLIDSLEHAGKDPVFSVLSTLHPELLTEYFMRCHPEVYYSGRVTFGELTPSDTALITKAAATTLADTGAREVMLRAWQLVTIGKNCKNPKKWVGNIAKEIAFDRKRGMEGDSDPNLSEYVRQTLERLIDDIPTSKMQIIAAIGFDLPEPVSAVAAGAIR